MNTWVGVLIGVVGVELGVIVFLLWKLALVKEVIWYETAPNRRGFRETRMNRIVMRAKFLICFKEVGRC